MTLSPGANAGCLYGLNAQHDPRQALIARRSGGDDDGFLNALEPIDLLFEFGDPLLALGQGHGVFAIRSISAVNRSTSTSG